MVTLTGLGGREDVPPPTRPPGALAGGSSLFFKLGKALTIKKNSFLFPLCVFRLLEHQTLGNSLAGCIPSC